MLYFRTIEDFSKYIKENSNFFIGKTLSGLFIKELIYEADYYDYDYKTGHKLFWDKDATEDVEFEINKKLTIQIDNMYLNVENNIDDCYSYNKQNTVEIDISHTLPDNLLNISHYYSKNIIGNKIVQISASDYFALTILLDNGFEFNVITKSQNIIYLHEWIPKKRKKCIFKSDRYEKYSIFKKYIDNIKHVFIGKKIEEIRRLGIIFDGFEYNSNTKPIYLDEQIDIKIGNNHLDICFNDQSDAFLGVNLFDGSETSSHDGFSWRNMNCIYRNNIINQTIKDMVLTKQDLSCYTDDSVAKEYEDNFEALEIILNNGYIFKITNWEDYMVLMEIKEM